MQIEYKKIFDGAELGRMTPREIHKKLLDELWHDDYEYQRMTGKKFKSKKGAEYLERLLFICPDCHKTTTLRSEGNRFFCTACGFETLYSAEGQLKPVEEGKHPVRTITGWLKWQNAFCERMIREMIETNSSEPIFNDRDVTLMIGQNLDPLKFAAQGSLTLYINRFVVAGEDGKEITCPIENVEGVQVLLANIFEFYFKGAVYNFKFKNPRTSGYKYICAIQKIAPEKTELE